MSRNSFASVLARADLLLQHLVTNSPEITEENDTMNETTKALYLADDPPTVVRLEIGPHFDALTAQQKRYAHHLSRAAFSGTRITLRQVSPESEAIYDLILAIHHACHGSYDELASKSGVSEEDVQAYLAYAAQFLGNCGNYKGFGDSKFVPRVSENNYRKIAGISKDCEGAYEKANTTGGGIYYTKEAGMMHLGYPEKGNLSTYYPDSPDIKLEDIVSVGDVLGDKGLLLENTRLRQTKTLDFEVLIASGESSPASKDRDLGNLDTIALPSGKNMTLVFGDHQKEIANAAMEVEKAANESANETQSKMLGEYARSFSTGSIQAFKESQKLWVQDKGPVLETNLGFVETYRDPHGVRGEWEGFVAMVNFERTKAFGKLVESSSWAVKKLPWSADFEKDKFLAPDFTSLEVLSFAGSGIPAGINIPNYDDVRQNLGFKNVSLGNVLSAKAPHEPIPFIREVDDQLYRDYRDPAFEVQVGIHELLGHGTGKLLQEVAPGEYNFDLKNPPISPITNKPVTTWYKPGQTWSSVFGTIASSYEECRAECVAMALSCEFGLLQLFGFGNGQEDIDGEAGNVLYVAYLQMARAGIAALEYWEPKSHKWGQIHMQARYAILKAFLSAGDNFIQMKSTKDDLSDLEIHLDRSKILSHGRPAVEDLLQKLHIYKSTADVEEGKKMYDEVTSVDEWWGGKVRPVVLSKKTPRKVFVQANTVLDEESGEVKLVEYEPTLEGMISSYAERNV